MTGTYIEKLGTGGELHVFQDAWQIRYYFAGPDHRYNGTFVVVEGKGIEGYITAWRENYIKYCEIKETILAGGEYQVEGMLGMSIRVGGFFEGVCLQSFHMPIRTEGQLTAVISDYEYAHRRAIQVMALMKCL